MTSINLTTLGCPKNMVDSRHLMESLVSNGFVPVGNPEEADIILVNTCGFIRDAKEESISEILKLAVLKKGPGKQPRKLVVFGCLAQRYMDELLREIPEIDGIWGVGEDESIIEYCKGVEVRKAGRQEAGSASELPSFSPSFAYLKIAEGCDKKCTFCVIPSIRGKFRSISPEDILGEARAYVKDGVRELIIVAQDITNYGREWKEYNLLSLLKDLVAIEGDFRIRLLYLYPTEITNELLDLMASEEKICKYLDIPLQHSEDRILRLMGRRGTRKEYEKLIRTIRRKIPGVILRTTFIVGFPTETEEDFRGLVDFVEETRFDRLGVFTFSKEEGTPSSKLKGQIPERTKKRRQDEIMGRQAAISLEKNMEMIGKKSRMIVDEADEKVIIGRLCSHAPEIDGVVIIERLEGPQFGSLEARKAGSDVAVGNLIDVEIVDAYDYDLKGKVIQ
ncbi:MAG TPA: 30S ribosomal protein S12 methylthiotransferase RimO [Dissulfurispiraceae bacterium]|nr:30S ribosomal protein S12 methylthiotransferase RimO [Dissulfurispiraceae bacterium]